MNRDEHVAKLSKDPEVWDFIIIGGGATGLGTAVEAASGDTKPCCWNSTIFQKAPPAAAPNWFTVACAI